MERARECVQPDALLVYRKPVAGSPARNRFRRTSGSVVFNAAPAPSAQPARKFVARSQIPWNRKCKAVSHHPSVNSGNFGEPNTHRNMRQSSVLQAGVQNGKVDFEGGSPPKFRSARGDLPRFRYGCCALYSILSLMLMATSFISWWISPFVAMISRSPSRYGCPSK